MSRRRSLATLLALVVGVAVAWWPALPLSAQCVAPTLSISPSEGPPGTPVTISGSNWYEGCYDPSSPAATYQGAPAPRPDSDINITFSDGRSTYEVARVTPAGNGSFSFQATVPGAAQPGAGSFRADGTNGAPTAGFAVGQKPPAPPSTTAGTAVARPPGAGTATTARPGGGVAGSSSGSSSRAGIAPPVPSTTVIFNPSTPLVTQTPLVNQYFATPGSPFAARSTPPVTLGTSSKGSADVWWVVGFLVVGLAAGFGYFLYQRNQRTTAWRPRGF